MSRRDAPELQSLDINKVIEEVAQLVHSDALIRGVTIQLDLAEGLPPVRSDRTQLQQVLLNLFVNAFDAMSGVADKREVVVQTKWLPDDGVTAIVQDSGPGFTPESIESVFEPLVSSKAGGWGWVSPSAGQSSLPWAEESGPTTT